MTPASAIQIRGARVHNLKSVDLDIPHFQITVLTGVSGSGKSSLAFDTLFAEGQRQYIESLSSYARQFLDQIPRPDVDDVSGLQPTLCIDQKSGVVYPRSTVATVTEIYDYLRLLYARAGQPHCIHCGSTIVPQAAEQIIDDLQRLPQGTKLVLLAPMIRGRRGHHREVFEQIHQHGWLRARVDGEMVDLEQVPPLAPRKLHTIEAVVDRLVQREGNEDRLVESARMALRTGGGVMTVLTQPSGADDWQEKLYSTLHACPDCGQSFLELEPRTFSFNSPYGACPECDGLGIGSGGETCTACSGGRLRPEALAVTIADTNIAAVTAQAIGPLIDWFQGFDWGTQTTQAAVAQPILKEVLRRLQYLQTVGLHYLTLDRPAVTLSGGELQRVRLATSIGSGLVGVCYVLDEPSIGLHPSDNDRLIDSIKGLQQQGNTVVVVEHDEAMIRAADRLVDIGPAAGPQGGTIVAVGTPAEVTANRQSLTGDYLAGRQVIASPATRRPVVDGRWLELTDVHTSNLKHVDVRIPLGLLVGVVGVSGSGKSSLTQATLVPALRDHLAGAHPSPTRQRGTMPDIPSDSDPSLTLRAGMGEARSARYAELRGADQLQQCLPVDQRPIGRGPRSCPATYSGVLDEIRKVFAATREAKQRGFAANRFSFNTAAGRCEDCKGQGQQKIEMNFLSDLYVLCPRCQGKRYNRQTLSVKFKGKTIADVLQMDIQEANEFFDSFSKIKQTLQALCDIGLGYLQLGQSSTTLSGGEAQRLKLGTELARPSRGHTLYLLDEPTTGLHFADIDRLLGVLQRLVDAGNTILVIEHHLDVIRACDWLIETGPCGGDAGGYLIAQGTPEQVAQVTDSPTGRYLAPLVSR